MSSADDQRMDIDTDKPELQRKEVSARSEIPQLAISDPAGVSLPKEKNLSPITPEMVQALYSEDVTIQLNTMKMICQLPLATQNPLRDEIINSGAVPRFVAFLNDTRYPELQFESAWVLNHIACGTSAQTQVVIDAGAVPVLSMLLSSPNEIVLGQSIWTLGNITGSCTFDQAQAVIESGAVPLLIGLISSSNQSIVENTVWCLGNIAFYSTESRDLVLNSNVLPPLLGLFRNDNASPSLMRFATLTLGRLCDKKPRPNFEQVSQCLPVLCRLIWSQDAQVVCHACWALSRLCEGPTEQIQVVVNFGVFSRAVQLLSNSSDNVVSVALFLVGNILAGTVSLVQVIINSNAVPALGRLLSHKEGFIVEQACRALSHITAGNEQQVQSVIDAKLLPSLIELLHHGAASVRKEAACAISNATFQSEEQIACIVDAGAIEPFCQLLSETDSDLIHVVLIGLERILCTGESFAKQAGSTVNPYATMVKKFDGLEKITILSSHNDPKIKEKASTILEMYLSTALVK